MNPDPRTLPNPYLTQNALRYLLRGLGLSRQAKGAVTRACRKLSELSDVGTINSCFSAYCTGTAPSLDELQSLLSEGSNKLQVLTSEEIRACRTFLQVRKAVEFRPMATERGFPSRWDQRLRPLHSFGGLNPTTHQPSTHRF